MVAASRRAGFQPTTTRAGDGITGPCPCCGGTDRVWIGSLPDGGPPWMAWSHGCSFEDMRSTLGRDASGHANGGGPGHNPVDSSTDEAGTPVFEVERRRAAGRRGQQFRPRHTAADDAVVWKLPPAGRGLVSPLPAVKRAIKNQDLVVGVAGENDADRLTSLHRCTPCHAAHLSGAARSVAGTATRVPVVDIAAFGHVQGRGDDVSNWLDTPAHDADLGLEALTAILHAASDYQPHPPATAAETEPPPPRTRPPRMPSTPGGGADQRLRAHDETLWVVTDAGAPPTVRVLDANAGTGGDGVAVLGSWLREMCEPRASDAGTAAITDAAVDPNQVGRDDRRAVKAGINPGRRDGGAAGPRVRAEGKSGVTECARSGPLSPRSGCRTWNTCTDHRPAASPYRDRNPSRRSQRAIAATRGSLGSPHRSGTRPGTRPRTSDSACQHEGDPPPQFTPVKWIPQSGIIGRDSSRRLPPQAVALGAWYRQFSTVKHSRRPPRTRGDAPMGNTFRAATGRRLMERSMTIAMAVVITTHASTPGEGGEPRRPRRGAGCRSAGRSS